ESHFSDKNWIYCAFLKLHCFSVYFNSAEKKESLPGTRGVLAECSGVISRCGVSGARRTRRVPGRGLSAQPLGTRGGLGCIRGSSRRECPRDTRRTRRAPGWGLRVRHSGTGVAFGGFRGKYHSLGF